MRWVLLILACLAIGACSWRELLGLPALPATPPAAPPAAPPAPPPLDDTALPADRAEALRRERDELRASLAGVESRLRAAEREAMIAPLRALTRWATYLGCAVALLAAAALVLLRVGIGLPIGQRLIIGIGAAGLTVAALALGLGQSLPWLGAAGLGLLVLVILAALAWAALAWRRAGRAAASEWSAYAKALPAELRERLDAESLRRQGQLADLVTELLPAPRAGSREHA